MKLYNRNIYINEYTARNNLIEHEQNPKAVYNYFS